MYTSSGFLALAIFIGTCFAQTQTVCNQNVCLETVKLNIDGDNVTIGIALPPKESVLNEFLMNVSVPSSYGFLSMQMGSNGPQMCDFSVTRFGTEGGAPPAPHHPHHHHRLNISGLRAQVCTPSDMNLLTNPMLANTTISSKSALFSGQLQIVSRINSTLFNQQDFFSAPSTVVRVTISESGPRYLDSLNMTALLDLSNASSRTFLFNRSAGTFENYTAMVEALGV
ncbi:hypothetical protein SCHPADRAFT_535204 [Schizopora paradoxa]|uniref:Uncharacterized protein n=1 Tax=Schizopora paradoxa TaxID=27342 RepID=A0A0H2RE03_9AGAM|nr:hypothetical protein SCHPADRAFT_535204 [Schizopora paradoxa]